MEKVRYAKDRPRSHYAVLSASFEYIAVAGWRKPIYFEIRRQLRDMRLTLHASLKTDRELGLRLELDLPSDYTPDSLKSLKHLCVRIIRKRISDLMELEVQI